MCNDDYTHPVDTGDELHQILGDALKAMLEKAMPIFTIADASVPGNAILFKNIDGDIVGKIVNILIK